MRLALYAAVFTVMAACDGSGSHPATGALDAGGPPIDGSADARPDHDAAVDAGGSASDAPQDAGPLPDSRTLCDETGFPILAMPIAGKDPRSVVVADVDRDQKPDLVVSNQGDSTVSVLRGLGGGRFDAKRDYPVAGAVVSSVVADLDRDGKLDLIAAAGAVRVRLGQADGTFGAATDVATGGSARWVTAADVNGDGAPDLVVSNASADQVSVLIGHGDGTFSAPVGYATSAAPVAAVAADLDGDGSLDLVVAYDNLTVAGGAATAVTVLLGRGDGTFRPAVDYPTGQSPSAVVAVDLNRDGALDLVVANALDRVNVLVGRGDGTFQPRVDYALVGGPASIAAADLDGDGALDVVVGLRSGSGGVVLFGDGDGTLRADAPAHVATGDGLSLAIADVSGDGKLDLIAPIGALGDVSVVLGNGDGTFQDRLPATGPERPAFLFADVNHDAKLDAITPNDRETIGVQLGNGDRTFQRFIPYDTALTALAATAADVDHDGNLDIVTANLDEDARNDSVSTLFGNGDGTFQAPVDQNILLNFTLTPTAIVAGDLDGDGNPDLVISANAVQVLLGDGHGRFRDSATYLPGDVEDVTLADLDRNGTLDLVLVTDDMVSILRGVGDGTFGAPTRLPMGAPGVLAVVDMNLDGVLDLVTITFDGGVAVWLGAGDGSFAVTARVSTGAFVSGLAVADVTGDGRPDILTGVSVLRGNGDGTVQPRVDFAVGGGSLADLDGDGVAELVSGGLVVSLKCPPAQ